MKLLLLIRSRLDVIAAPKVKYLYKFQSLFVRKFKEIVQISNSMLRCCFVCVYFLEDSFGNFIALVKNPWGFKNHTTVKYAVSSRKSTFLALPHILKRHIFPEVQSLIVF